MLQDKELLEALSSARVLTSMITPAVLISAAGTLIFSTSNRLGRVFDRVNSLKSEIESVLAGTLPFAAERMEFLKVQVQKQRVRARLIQHALAALYTATALFVASSLGIAFNVAYGSRETSWIPTALALSGGLFLFAASAILIYESRHNLTFINRHIDFVEYLEEQYGKQNGKHTKDI
ncbi:DUF2721 domain-containing protein [Geobacter sulfurreducens]|jgi:hypothetical protein|uniref:DUF2721 domain-containing protein n=1 Tax=Geobacter sulfurreducens (strain ATCC 51573 / DSM 12127 / PCA) TaxID=243231 RepID=Q74ED6_GEOSL|nr:DUF2721 domain-containing protein [Geobacter sulfurreducens]AAR34353.1 protein of unknown function DUF2721 [Geobacter sulfurreducens PCA]QVW36264.1 DUF2721 domain-containing protein [Geobacter sulfurreducens]UAC05075.1 DUF2721 domain-containing protein [Geobacter sulfurreducens]UTG93711.1 DUF2721 domain-containing protein [Geobacter sulfurreducens]HBB69102.1 DUF2721 domain-containing protein [Geobacter sulfurreducens]